MSQIAQNFQLNLEILKRCRNQMSLSQDDVRSKIRKLIVRVEQYRDLLLELRQDIDDPVHPFSLPNLLNINQEKKTASIVRKWLSIDDTLDFTELKSHLEQKSIFVFLTSKYKGWSHVDNRAFRGLSMTHEVMPIIIMNDLDSRKAQSFTLIHELCHLIRGDTNIDGENTADSKIEKWCDKLAGEILMPASSSIWEYLTDTNLSEIKKLAKRFKVSPYAVLVRLRQLKKIDQQTYLSCESKLKQEYEDQRKKLQNKSGGLARNRTREIKKQFGNTFVNAVLSAWRNQEITLHKATKLLGLKRPQQFLELEDN